MSWCHETKLALRASLMQKMLPQQRMSGPTKSSTTSSILGYRTRESNHGNSRCALLRCPPSKGCPCSASKASSWPRISETSDPLNSGTGKKKPSLRNWATASLDKHFGITDPYLSLFVRNEVTQQDPLGPCEITPSRRQFNHSIFSFSNLANSFLELLFFFYFSFTQLVVLQFLLFLIFQLTCLRYYSLSQDI